MSKKETTTHKFFYEIATNKYFFASNDVKVFPNAYRRVDIDPEARMNSEFNLTHLGASSLGNGSNSYIIKNITTVGDASKLRVILGGYYFELTYNEADMAELFPSASDIYLSIKTVEYPFYQASQATEKKTAILEAFYGNTITNAENVTYLDQKIETAETVYFFVALMLSNTPPSEATASLRIFRKENDSFVLDTQNMLPHIANYSAGKYSMIFNDMTNEANSEYSNAFGRDTKANGNYSTAEGYKTKALSESSHAEGSETTAGDNTSAETLAASKYAHAEGNATVASKEASHAEGKSTIASNTAAHAEGQSTTASGEKSHAEGYFTVASGEGAHAEGVGVTSNKVTASGKAAHAENYETVASGYYSHAEGNNTEAKYKSQHVFGEFNTLDSKLDSQNEDVGPDKRGNYVEIVGKGSDNTHRSNARTLDWSGNEWLAGELTIGGLTDTDTTQITGERFVLADANNKLISTANAKDLSVGHINISASNHQGMSLVGTFAGTARDGETLLVDNDLFYGMGEFHVMSGNPYVILNKKDGNGGFDTSVFADLKTTTIDNATKGCAGAFFTLTSGTPNYELKLTESSGLWLKNNLTIDSLTASNAVCTDANKNLISRAISDSSSAEVIGTSTNFVTERDVYYGLPTINNKHDYTSSSKIFAPITKGYKGELLISDGDATNQNPKWLTYGAEEGMVLQCHLAQDGVSPEMPTWAAVGNEKNAVLAWDTLVSIAHIGDVKIGAKLPPNPNTHYTKKLSISDGTTNAVEFTQDDDKTLSITGDGCTVTATSGNIKISVSASSDTVTTLSDGTNQGGINWATSDGVTRSEVFSPQLSTSGTPTFSTVNTTSDRRLKENIKDFDDTRSILDLKVKEFDLIEGKRHSFGFIAQELQEVYPELVHDRGDGYLAIEETKLVYLLLDEVKKLRKELDELKK